MPECKADAAGGAASVRVLLNTDPLLAWPHAGVAMYTWHLAQGLQRHAAVEELLFFSRAAPQASTRLTLGRAGRSRLPIHWLSRFPLAYWARRKLNERRFAATLAGHAGYVYHSPSFLLFPCPGPSVVTVHDLSHRAYPQHHPRGRVRHLEQRLAESLNRASRIITDAESTRADLIAQYGVAAERVHAIPLGVAEDFHPRTAETLAPVLARYHIAGLRYLLCVGTLEPRKNLLGLVQAYSRLPAALRAAHPLVMAGARGWKTGATERALAPLEREGCLLRLDYVPRQDLPALYAGAHAFAYPSLYEGFGLPVLEAMASAVPVLTSDRSSLPEVAGDAAWLCDPEDTDALSAGLRHLLEDPPWREAAAARGLSRAAGFTWQRCTDATVAIYQLANA